eukprot:gene11855-13752_t
MALEGLACLESLPRDDDDSRFVKSFDCVDNISTAGAVEFFNEYGFVVLRSVFNSSECERTREAMWSILESDVHTEDPFSDVGDLIVSHDRFTVYRATVLDEELQGVVDGAQFTTGDRNIHIDMNPWWWLESSTDILKGLETLQYKHKVDQTIAVDSTGDADVKAAKKAAKASAAVNEHADFVRENNMVVECMGRHVQCVMNFLPNLPEDGGTLVVPMFHKYMRKYCEDYKHLRKPLPWVQFSKEVEEVLLAHAHRVPMREGSVLVWDQRVAHGTAPNTSSTCRMAQYLKAGLRTKTFPVDRASSIDGTGGGDAINDSESISVPASSRLLRRSTALDYILRQNNARDIVTPLGEKLFALDVL